jgi:hypothetical protein
MSSEIEYTTYDEDGWPDVPENEDVILDGDDEDDWHSPSAWATSGDRTEVLINQGRTSAKGWSPGGRLAGRPHLGGHPLGGPGLGNHRYGRTGLGGTGLGGPGAGSPGTGRTRGMVGGGGGLGASGGGLGGGQGTVPRPPRGAAGRSRRLSRRKVIVWGGAALGLGIMLAVVLPGGNASWPESVATVKKEIQVACQNPNVASDPGQVNFACATSTNQILWVFSLLTSDNKANFTDRATGRTGLEPITPTQGGEVAWSLNLHHPYSPTNPTDSLTVAARAINNIIGGATVTSQNGAQVVEPGLEASPANCQRYTGSTALVVRQGFPSVCAKPVTTAAGEAALVADVYRQWMVDAPSQDAANAALLFTNAGNPGDSGVQAILHTLAAG